MKLLQGILALALAFVPYGCNPGDGIVSAGESSRASMTGSSAPSTSAEPLLERVQRAVNTVPHVGERHYEAHVYQDGADLTLAYTERVSDRGDGCYSIDPLETRSNVGDPFVFLGLQRERQAFFRRYRDFQIRDIDLFRSNYVVHDEGQRGTVAGRPVTVLRAEARRDGRSYLLSIDDETALVLAYREELADGTLLSSMRYTSFAPLSGETVDCFSNEIEEEPLQLRGDFEQQLGFGVWSPALVPDGYEPYEASRVRDPRGFDWFKLAFTDGAETLFFLQRSPPDPAAQAEALSLAGAPEGAHDDRVLVYEVGPLSVVQGSLASREVMAVGKVDSRELLRLLESARR